ncbi:dickkopf-related protein 2-like isoform X1 [Syngnathus acus]|uniref:dickkopf-related protein 2-like isoform X1 n=1 Tax=Syngnathus acus TaxID=161584 RepID=UPI001885D2A1|nr:dickkopf-related protein 2-like isoform X1 [Syngnathus acus]
MTKRRFRGLVLRGVMTRDVDALLCAFILTMLACACGGGEARVRLNSIRTVVVHKGPEASFNRSAWELTLRQCISDLECNEGSYCHAPYRSSAHSRCRTCRRRKKRCHRDGMCCPGNFCSNSVCVREATASQQIALQHVAPSPKARWRKRDKMELRGASGQGQVGDPCLTSADCWDELCCARHLWTRICKPVLQEGQVCSARRRKRRQGGLELFQRCPCVQGLACRAPPAAGPPSSPLMAAAKSKLAAYSRRPRPHAVKARLHECRRK